MRVSCLLVVHDRHDTGTIPAPICFFAPIPQTFFRRRNGRASPRLGRHKNNALNTRLRQRGFLFTTTGSCSKRARCLCPPPSPQNIIILGTCSHTEATHAMQRANRRNVHTITKALYSVDILLSSQQVFLLSDIAALFVLSRTG